MNDRLTRRAGTALALVLACAGAERAQADDADHDSHSGHDILVVAQKHNDTIENAPSTRATTDEARIAATVNAVSGFKFNGTSGVTTTCSGGQFLQNQVVQGGIVTGGTCATAGGGITTVGSLDGGTANATGATISGSSIYLQSASTSYAGLVNITTQSFAGDKTFIHGFDGGPTAKPNLAARIQPAG